MSKKTPAILYDELVSVHATTSRLR
jgi:hypothetical protein